MSARRHHEEVASVVLKALRQGRAPWQLSWSSDQALPYNPSNGNRYRGANSLFLQSQGETDPRWLTEAQALEAGGTLAAGERGTRLVQWQFTAQEPKRGWFGKQIKDERGEPVMVTVNLEKPRQTVHIVYNASQFEGLPPMAPAPERPEALQRVEKWVAATRMQLHDGVRVGYDRKEDAVRVPASGRFNSWGDYYATVLRGFGHWTGHESRLDRPSHPPGTVGHARESLRVELAAMLLGREFGIPHDPPRHPDTRRWEKLLEEDPRELFRACADAERIVDKALQLERDNGLQVVAPVQRFGAVSQDDIAFFGRDSEPSVVPTVQYQEGGRVVSYTLHDADTDKGKPSEPHTTFYERQPDGSLLPGQRQPSAQQPPAREPKTTFYERQPDGSLQDGRKERQSDEVAEEQTPSKRSPLPPPLPRPGKSKTTFYERQPDGSLKDGRGTDGFELVDAATTRLVDGPTDASKEAIVVPENNGRSYSPSWGRPKLAVPYEERKEAGKHGASWDRSAKVWYAKEGADMDALSRWDPRNVAVEQQAPLDARAELAEALQGMGFVLDGQHPIMDGEPHRCPVQGDGRGQKGGFYVAHADGTPNAWMKNHRTAEERKWVAKGYSLSAEEKVRMRAVSQAKKQELAEATQAKYEKAAGQAREWLQKLQPVRSPVGYLEAKGLQAHAGVYVAQDQSLFVPMQDVDGKVWSLHKIEPNGFKKNQPMARKEGLFHVVGDEPLTKGRAIVLAEGYSTAAAVAEALGQPVVSVGSSGNLPAVAKALRERHPTKAIVIAADDDTAPPKGTAPPNAGQRKAQEAAQLVGGSVLTPKFAPGEQARNPRGFSDWHDLLHKSSVGRQAAQRQLREGLREVLNAHRSQNRSRTEHTGLSR